MEINWVEIALAIVTLIATGGWVTNYVQMRTIKATQLKAIAEAKSVELDNDDSKLNQLNKIIDAMEKRIGSLEKEVDFFRKRDEINDKKIDKKRKIIRAAYKCKIPSDQCAVLLLQEELDKEEMCNDCKTN